MGCVAYTSYSEGEEWQQVRTLLGKHMLVPQAVEEYDATLNGVVSDLLANLQQRRRQNPHGLVTDIANDFYHFGLEVFFGSRLGCLELHFLKSINTMFAMTLLIMAMPGWLHRIFTKPWNMFCQCWDYMFRFAKGHIDQHLEKEAEGFAFGEKARGHSLTSYLSQRGLPMKAVYSNVTELLLAGVDTISSTLSWSLYELSWHPETQAALQEGVQAVLGGRMVPSASDVARLPLMKAVVKEVLRLYPVIPANASVISNRDIQVGGYLIPKKTLISLCHYGTSWDSGVFSDPGQFRPQRWLSCEQGFHPYASVPFGVGKHRAARC